MKRSQYTCGLEAALDVISSRWKLLILWRLFAKPRRFGELKRQVSGVSEKMLIQQLREMEADGLVIRTAFPEVPPRVEYALTPMAVSLKAVLAPLCKWGEKHIKAIGKRHLECEAVTVKKKRLVSPTRKRAS